MLNILLALHVIILTYINASKPHSKRPQEIWYIECQLGIIKDPDCPIDGGWSAWTPWSPCKGPCDGMGFKTRSRQCNNPPPSVDGIPCLGNDEDTVSCYLTDCTIDDYRRLASGNWPRMEAMHQLEIIPTLMERCLQTDCPYEAIDASLADDNTWGLNPEAVWNSLQCVKQNMGCVVTGEWGAWGEWSSCSARCGKGERYRLRRCDSPPPSGARQQCTGIPLEAQSCEGDQCAIEKHVMYYNVGGAWGEWEPWSRCSETCGPGARRRRRICKEKAKRQIATWGTQCPGNHDELQVCNNLECVLDGGWSGWGIWGPCSRTCGAGRRVRYRTCTRPVPTSGGAPCVGLKTDVDYCHLNPCVTFTHLIAVLNGDSFLNFHFKKKRSTFFHLFIRFMPLSPYGTLVRRGELRDPLVRISLQKWRVCLEASGVTKSCNLHRVCSPTAIEPAVWHNVLVTITNHDVSLRLNDAPSYIRSTFPCNPELANDNMNIFIGEKFHGEIQEVILNFIPLSMFRSEKSVPSDFFPTSVRNLVFEEGNIEEGFLDVPADYYLRLPCFKSQVEWRLEITVKPKRDSGTLLFLQDDNQNSWLHLSLQNMRLKLQVSFNSFRTESYGSTDYYPDEWLDVVMLKPKDSASVEASINSGERIYAVLEENARIQRKTENCKLRNLFKKTITSPILTANFSDDVSYESDNVILPLCDDEFFVGSIPYEYRVVVEDGISFIGVIGMLSINGIMQDLHKISLERSRRDGAQLSSRTASVSGFYHEAAWGFSNRLNLTCLHARMGLPLNTAQWLFLDTVINNIITTKTARSIDDGRVLRLVASADKDMKLLRGFYTCRSHSKRQTHNIVTYGVLGKIPEKLSSPDTITAIALVTTLTLIIGTLSWMFMEALHDLRNGYGYFRDRHLTPEEEAEAVCDYIDQNIHLIGSRSAAEIAKARARRKGRKKQEARSKESVAAQEPQGMMEELDTRSTDSSDLNLPAIKLSKDDVPNLYSCEPCYVSSPRHGSSITPRPYLTSSSTDTVSPRILCSRLLISRGLRNKNYRKRVLGSGMPSSKLLTIKSSTFVDQSPARRILDMFRKLKAEDPE